MAVKLPTYQSQVQQAPLQRTQVVVDNSSIAPGLDAVGRGISNLGQGVGMYAARREAEERRERDKANELRGRTVLAEIAAGKRDFLETPLDADGNGGLLNKRGQNAIKASVDDAKVFEQFVEGKLEGLTPEQRDLIRPAITAELSDFSSQADRHVSRQMAEIDKQSSEATLEVKANDMASAAQRGDMDALENAYGAGLGEVGNRSRALGEDEAMLKARQLEYTDRARRGVIESLLGTNPEEAERLFIEWRPSLVQAQVLATKLEERVYDASAKAFGETVADEAIAAHGTEAPGVIEAMDLKDISNEAKTQALNAAHKKLALRDQLVDAADSELLGSISQDISRGQGSYTIADLQADGRFKKLGKEKARADAFNMVEAQRRARSKNPNERQKQSDIDSQALANYRRRVAEDPRYAVTLDTDGLYSTASVDTRDQIGALRAKTKEDLANGNSTSLSDFKTAVEANLPPGLDREVKEAEIDRAIRWHLQRESELQGKKIPRTEQDGYIQREYKDKPVDTGSLWWKKKISRGQARIEGINVPEEATAPTPTQAPAPGTVRMLGKDGKTYDVRADQVEVAKSRGAVIVQ